MAESLVQFPHYSNPWPDAVHVCLHHQEGASQGVGASLLAESQAGGGAGTFVATMDMEPSSQVMHEVRCVWFLAYNFN